MLGKKGQNSKSKAVEEPSRETLADKATNSLRKAILDLSLEPGMRLDERELDIRFGISRTPAREALNRLVSEELVKAEPNVGFFVTPLDLGEIRRFFDAYMVEEKAIAYFCDFDDAGFVDDLRDIYKRHVLAQRKVDADAIQETNSAFHLRIAQATHNDHLRAFSNKMQNHSQRITYFIYKVERQLGIDLKDEHALIQEQHGQIVAAIEGKNREALESAISEHVMQFHGRVTRMLSHFSGAGFGLTPTMAHKR